MKNVMTRAWEIAKEGQRKFGGKVSEYLAEALKMAWAETRRPKQVKVSVNYGWKKCYVAKINGTHPKWKLDRSFLKADKKHRSYSGKTGHDEFYIMEDGIYEKASGDNREYFIIENGTLVEVDFQKVLQLVG